MQDVATGGVAVAAMAEDEEGTGVPMLTPALVTTTKVSSVHNRLGRESLWVYGFSLNRKQVEISSPFVLGLQTL